MATFKEIQDRVTRRVIDQTSVLATEVPALINRAQRKLQNLHDFRVTEALQGPLTTTAGAQGLSAAVPSNWRAPRGKPFYRENDNTDIPIVWADDLEQVQSVFDPADTVSDGPPAIITRSLPSDDLGTTTWEVYPIPDALSDYSDGNYRVYIPYFKYVADLSADADTNWFTVNADEYLERQTVAEAFWAEWNEERAAIWEQRAVEPFEIAKKADKHERRGIVTHLRFSMDVHADKVGH